MNDFIKTQLKVIVERAVRPVRASTSAKRRMREELLAHVTATLEEEAAGAGGEQAALERTAARFGNPARLAGQLQESVSPGDRIKCFVEQLWSRPGEFWLRRAFRQALLIELIILIVPLPFWFMSGTPTNRFWIAPFRRLEAPLVAFFLLAFSFTFLAEWMRRALYGSKARSWLKILLVGTTCGVMDFTFCLMLERSFHGWPAVDMSQVLWGSGLALLLTTGGLATLASVADARIRYDRQWANLQIT